MPAAALPMISDRQIEFAKAEPSLSDLHVVQALSDVSISYAQDEIAFIAPNIFAEVMSPKQSNKYFLFDEGDFHRDEAKERAPGTESEGSGYAQTNAQFDCVRYSFHKDIPSEDYNNEDDASEVEINSTEFVTQKLLISRERKTAAVFFKTGVWATDITGVAAGPGAGQALRWDKAGSSPFDDLETGATTIGLQTGRRPNKAVFGADVWRVVKNHADFIDRIKYTQMGQISEGLVGTLIGADGTPIDVYVGRAVYNTAAKGQTASNSYIWDSKSVLLTYSNPTPSRRRPSGGYLFTWNGYYGAEKGTRIKRLEMPIRDSVRIEGDTAFVPKLVGTKLGYFLSGIVT